MKKNLTLRYSITQFSYWAASTGALSFVTTYLLDRGLSPGVIGALLATAGILSFLTQPLLASVADKATRFLLPMLMQALSAMCILCFCLQLLPGLPALMTGILYLVSIWCSDAIVPLLNALSVACNDGGFTVHYGAARGIGSAASAIGSLVLGFIIARLGSGWMFGFLIIFRLICMISLAGYPKLSKIRRAAQTGNSCTIPVFFARYKWYCVSLLGVSFLAMFLAMTENYMIAIMQNLGGNSSHVGTALFIASMVGAPVICCFSFFRKHLKDTTLLKIAGITFLLRAVLLCFAKSIAAVYCLQLMHATSYAFLAPTQVYYASAKTRSADMVKGQAFITAAYALGCSGGDFIGGQLLSRGVDTMLLAGIAMTFAGTLILFLTVHKQD